MKKSLIFVTIIGLLVTFSSVGFGQKKSSPAQAPAGASKKATGQTTQTATQTDARKMQESDKTWWITAEFFTEKAFSILLKPQNGFEDDNTFRLLKQYTQEAYTLLNCQQNNISPCNMSSETDLRITAGMEEVREYLNKAKDAMIHLQLSTPEKTQILPKVERALELAEAYLAAYKTPPTKKSKSTASSNKSSGSQPSPQKAGKPSTGFMDYTDDTAVKSPKNTKKTDGFQTTSEDLQSLKAPKKATNSSGADNPENTQKKKKTPTTRKPTKTAPKKP